MKAQHLLIKSVARIQFSRNPCPYEANQKYIYLLLFKIIFIFVNILYAAEQKSKIIHAGSLLVNGEMKPKT